MKMETYLTAEQLGISEGVRSAIITAMKKLAGEEYNSFNMMYPNDCAVAKVNYEYCQAKDHHLHEVHLSHAMVNDEWRKIFGGEFLSPVRHFTKMLEVKQKDAAWVWRHYLTTGRCPTPDEYEARQVEVLILEEVTC